MRAKKTLRSQRPKRPAPQIRWRRTPGAKASTYLEWAVRSRGLVFAAMFVIVAAALLAAREDGPRTEPVNAGVSLEPIAENRAEAPSIPREREAVKTVAAKPAVTPVPQPPASVAAAPANHTAEPEAQRLATVTVTGCIDSEDGAFRLTDASGAEAPTSRSWKSGFLKKRPASIALEDAAGTLALRSHVGRRVAATGTLIDREMRARSLRVIGSCE